MILFMLYIPELFYHEKGVKKTDDDIGKAISVPGTGTPYEAERETR
jgi:hypothetical protein